MTPDNTQAKLPDNPTTQTDNTRIGEGGTQDVQKMLNRPKDAENNKNDFSISDIPEFQKILDSNEQSEITKGTKKKVDSVLSQETATSEENNEKTTTNPDMQSLLNLVTNTETIQILNHYAAIYPKKAISAMNAGKKHCSLKLSNDTTLSNLENLQTNAKKILADPAEYYKKLGEKAVNNRNQCYDQIFNLAYQQQVLTVTNDLIIQKKQKRTEDTSKMTRVRKMLELSKLDQQNLRTQYSSNKEKMYQEAEKKWEEMQVLIDIDQKVSNAHSKNIEPNLEVIKISEEGLGDENRAKIESFTENMNIDSSIDFKYLISEITDNVIKYNNPKYALLSITEDQQSCKIVITGGINKIDFRSKLLDTNNKEDSDTQHDWNARLQNIKEKYKYFCSTNSPKDPKKEKNNINFLKQYLQYSVTSESSSASLGMVSMATTSVDKNVQFTHTNDNTVHQWAIEIPKLQNN